MRISRLPDEPDASSLTALQVLLRLPSGQRLERRFTETDKLEVRTVAATSFIYSTW